MIVFVETNEDPNEEDKAKEFVENYEEFVYVYDLENKDKNDELDIVRQRVKELCAKFPVYK